MAETNVSCVWNSGVLEFRRGEPGNSTGALLFSIDPTNNGVAIQAAQAAAAVSNALNFTANFSIHITDSAGTTYYIPAKTATW